MTGSIPDLYKERGPEVFMHREKRISSCHERYMEAASLAVEKVREELTDVLYPSNRIMLPGETLFPETYSSQGREEPALQERPSALPTDRAEEREGLQVAQTIRDLSLVLGCQKQTMSYQRTDSTTIIITNNHNN